MNRAQVKLTAQNGDRTVTAHRGASSYVPEHTLAAYAMAHGQGADYLEPDIILTKDGVLLCVHDLYLESTTDVAQRFPDRQRADGHFYAIDLTLAEVKSLLVFGRIPATQRPERSPGHQIVTLEELILLVRGLNEKTGRNTGLLIESKNVAFQRGEGKPLEQPLLDILNAYGYTELDCGVIIQSFESDHLQRLRQEYQTRLPLMFLTGNLAGINDIDALADWADGLNPSRNAVETPDGTPIQEGLDVLHRAQEKGLRSLVWTFNADDDAMKRFLYQYGVDGVITNNPDAGVRVVRNASR